jgi:sigma-E factor negative regulatory protein RseA
MVIRGENVKSRVSELMDGELDGASAAEVIAAIENGDDMLSDWKTYHMIGDALRQPIVSIDISEQVKKRLAGEPLLLVPHLLKPHRFRKQKLVGLSVAASIAALSLGWLVTQSMEQHQALQEVYIAENLDENTSASDKRSVTFQPASIYTFPPAPMHNNGNYPLIYRGFTHGGMVYHPHAGTHQIAEPQEKSMMSSE